MLLDLVSSAGGGLDLFPLTDPSTFSKLVAGYRQDRYLSHFGERFVKLASDILQQDGGGLLWTAAKSSATV